MTILQDYNSEKSLLEVWSKTLPQLPTNKFNSIVSKFGISLGIIPIFLGPIPKFYEILQSSTDLLSNIYAGLLGFIIAGYAIFTTAGNPDFLLAIWKHKNSKTRIPLLKMHLLVFIRLFIVVFGACFFCLSFSIMIRFSDIFRENFFFLPDFEKYPQIVFLALIGWTISAVGIQIKCLIFNLYDLTLTQVKFLEINSICKNKASPKETDIPQG